MRRRRWTRRLGRFARLPVGRTAGIRRLWSTGWWNSSRRWTYGRFAGRTFGGWRRAGRSGELGLLLQPILIRRRFIDHQLTLHAVMPEAAKLATHDFEFASLDR